MVEFLLHAERETQAHGERESVCVCEREREWERAKRERVRGDGAHARCTNFSCPMIMVIPQEWRYGQSASLRLGVHKLILVEENSSVRCDSEGYSMFSCHNLSFFTSDDDPAWVGTTSPSPEPERKAKSWISKWDFGKLAPVHKTPTPSNFNFEIKGNDIYFWERLTLNDVRHEYLSVASISHAGPANLAIKRDLLSRRCWSLGQTQWLYRSLKMYSESINAFCLELEFPYYSLRLSFQYY